MQLAELVVARSSAVEAQTALNNQLAAAEGKLLKRQLVRSSHLLPRGENE